MLPVGPLMEEHRIIERIVPLIRGAAEAARRDGRIDLRQVDLALDFIRTYADRCHHGKEEDILFAALERKPLTAAHRRTLAGLLAEHRRGRRAVREVAAAAESYRGGDQAALTVIIAGLEFLADLYPRHIKKEDQDFFLPVMDYFDQAEKEELIEAEREFDRGLIHAIYRDKVRRIGVQEIPAGAGRL